MKRNTCLNFLYVSMIALATSCVPFPTTPDLNATATQDSLNRAVTQTAAPQIVPTPTSTATPPPSPIPSETGTPTPTLPPVMGQQFIAYVNNGQLLVTDITNGVQGGTTQYTLEGESDQVTELVWSPSGEYVAFVSTAQGEPHLFYIFALGQSSPTDLGPGSSPAWSPDSQSLAYISGTYPDDNIWVTTIENPAPRQLTFESNYAWGRPVFTPDGQSLVVAGTDRNNMGAQGNTTFLLEWLSFDRGLREPLPGGTPFEGGRLPYDLRFSPDGTRLAFSSSFHLSACASPGAYFVSNADGSNRQELISPSLKVALDPDQERYHMGFSFAWNPTSDALVAHGNVVDCDFNSPTVGQSVAGPQMSVIRLDGTEQVIIPGFFYDISMDRTGTLIAATHSTDIQDLNPLVEIYSAQTGQLVLSLGPGGNPQFQP